MTSKYADRALTDMRRALQTGSPRSIAQTAMENFWWLYSAHFDVLMGAIESLPSSLLERYPVLRTFHRLTPVLARTSRPYKPLVAPDTARLLGPDELDLLTLAQMMAFRYSGDIAGALVYARRLEDRILQIRTESRERTDGPLWFYYYQIGSTLLVAGDSSSALLALATARQLSMLSEQPNTERVALGGIALAHAVRGSLDDAECLLAELTALPAVGEAYADSASAVERSAAALVAVERMTDDVEDLLAVLDPYDSLHLSWGFDLLARTRALTATQRPSEALEAVRLARDSHPRQHGAFASDVIRAASIDGLWGIGDAAAARRLAEESPSSGVLTDLSSARLALHESRFDEAARALGRVTDESARGPGAWAELRLLYAWLELSETNALSPATATRIALLSAKGGLRRALATVPHHLVSHIALALPAEDADAFTATTLGLIHTDAGIPPSLTPGEHRVLQALPGHATIAQIASTLHVSPNTIKSQLRAVYRKLDCSTRDEATRIATRLHLLTKD